MSKFKSRRKGSPTRLLYLLLVGLLIPCFLNSCNVTRKITTESSYVQKGDTSCVITTKTIETYDARKNLTPIY